MSGFSSLLNQFKQTTQQQSAISSLSSRGRGGGGSGTIGSGSGSGSGSGGSSTAVAATSDANKKRPHSDIIDHNSSSSSSPRNFSHPWKKQHPSNQQQQQQQYRHPENTPVHRIYIPCPAFVETGGPEALHQFCHAINSGGYRYDDDDDVDVDELGNDAEDNDGTLDDTAGGGGGGGATGYDEFGRAITPSSSNNVGGGSTKGGGGDGSSSSSSSSNGNNATRRGGSTSAGTDDKNKRVLKAYMLYLRERGSEVEHVTSSRARSPKYDRYDAPPAPCLPGQMMEYSMDTESGGVPGRDDGGGSGDANTNNNNNNKGRKNDGEYSSELVVWPECWTHLIDSLQPRNSSNSTSSYHENKKHQTAIWWLSVNNNKGRFLPEQFAIRKDVLHFVQSAYAREYVSSMLRGGGGRGNATGNGNGGNVGKEDGSGGGGGGGDDEGRNNVLTLTEFIPHSSPTFAPNLNHRDGTPTTTPTTSMTTPTTTAEGNDNDRDRDLDVVYNPAKGMHYTDEIIRRACGKKAKTRADGSVTGGGITFSPIGKGRGGRERLTGEEVVALLKRSKVVSVVVFFF